MAKRSNDRTRATGGTTTADAMEARVVAFAEQIGRIAGSFQAKAEGWLDRGALTHQVASVRDSATELLEHITRGKTKGLKRGRVVAAARAQTKGRSGGVVDAPGKKRRKPMPSDPGASIADSQAAKVRMARPMVKTNRRRGRG